MCQNDCAFKKWLMECAVLESGERSSKSIKKGKDRSEISSASHFSEVHHVLIPKTTFWQRKGNSMIGSDLSCFFPVLVQSHILPKKHGPIG